MVGELMTELGRVIVGQRDMLERLLIGLLSDGHVLLEGVPGLAKTLTVRTLADAIDAAFTRIQFTPDLLPGRPGRHHDLQPAQRRVHGAARARSSPTSMLADEINRAPAKVQSALLEAMQEQQVTIGDQTFPLPEPFLVLATQNPIEQEGTYPLPEAQVDRFMLKVKVELPDARGGARDHRPHDRGWRSRTARRCSTPEQMLAARARGARDLRRREDQGLHPRPGVRDARAGRRGPAELAPLHRVRRLARARRSPSPGPPRRTRSCATAATSPRRTSRRSASTCSATASSSPTRPRRRT